MKSNLGVGWNCLDICSWRRVDFFLGTRGEVLT